MLKTVFHSVILLLIYIAVTLLGWPRTAYAAPIEVTVGVSNHSVSELLNTWKQYPKACEQDDLFSEHWPRITLEFFILCRAIRLGGIEAIYTFRSYPNSARTRAELKEGSVMVIVDFPWGDFADDKSLYKSTVVLPVGSFVKGLYTRQDRTDVLSVKTLEQLQSYVGVTSKTWVYDWAAMNELGVIKHHVSKYYLMTRMVANRRADFYIEEFPGTKDLSQNINGVRFVPIPGVKVILRGSRHIALSKKVPHSKEVFNAIQAGLKILKRRGLILQGYRISGFFNPVIEKWQPICCEADQAKYATKSSSHLLPPPMSE